MAAIVWFTLAAQAPTLPDRPVPPFDRAYPATTTPPPPPPVFIVKAVPPPPPPPPRAPRPVAATPSNSAQSWVTMNDYPEDAKRDHAQGDVGFTLSIGADGKPLSCKVTKSSGWKSLDDTSCALLLRRGTFVPARDAAGKPTEGSYTSSVRWRDMSWNVRPPTPMPVPLNWTVSYIIEPDGQKSHCNASGNIPVYMIFSQSNCEEETFRVPDDARRPVRKRVVWKMVRTVEDIR